MRQSDRKHYSNTNNPIDFPKSKMNERIKELAREARQYAQQYVNESVIEYGKTASEFRRIYESKFAELIVRECSRIAKVNQAEDMGWDIGEILLEHFGVE
jgi:hypothetical protein